MSAHDELPDFCREGCYWMDCGHERGLRVSSEGYVSVYSWGPPPPPLPVAAYPLAPFGVRQAPLPDPDEVFAGGPREDPLPHVDDVFEGPPRGEDEQRDS